MDAPQTPFDLPSLDDEFHELVGSLIQTLQEESRQHQRFLRVVRSKRAAMSEPDGQNLETILRTEKEVLADCVTIERDRLAILLALGERVGGESGKPRRLRIAELVSYTHPEDRDELLDLRDEIRDVADELEDLTSGGSFSRHASGNMRLYLREDRWGDRGGEAIDEDGTVSWEEYSQTEET